MAHRNTSFNNSVNAPPAELRGKRKSVHDFTKLLSTRKLLTKAKYSIGDPVLSGLKKGAATATAAMAEAVHLQNTIGRITRSHLHPKFEEVVEQDGIWEDETVPPETGWSTLNTVTPVHLVKCAGQLWEKGEGGHLVIVGRDRESLGVYIMDCATAKWSEPEPLRGAPSARYGHSVVLASGALIIFGGWTREETFNETYFVTLSSTSRKRKFTQPNIAPAQRPPKRAFHSAVLVDYETMLIFGGASCSWDGEYTYLDDLWSLNIKDFVWKPIEAIGECPSARAQHSAVMLGDNMAVMCGVNSHWALNDFFLLLTHQLMWRQLSTPHNSPFRRVPCQPRHHKPPIAYRPAVVWGGVIYFYGGGPIEDEGRHELIGVMIDGLDVRCFVHPIRVHPQRWHHLLFARSDGSLFMCGGCDHTVTYNGDKAKRYYNSIFYLDLNIINMLYDPWGFAAYVEGDGEVDQYNQIPNDHRGQKFKYSDAATKPMHYEEGEMVQYGQVHDDPHGQKYKYSEEDPKDLQGTGHTGLTTDSFKSDPGFTLTDPLGGEVKQDIADSFKTDAAFTLSDPMGGFFDDVKPPTTKQGTQYGDKLTVPGEFGYSDRGRRKNRKQRTFDDDIYRDHVPVFTSKLIGKGTFGKVYQGLHPETGEFVAVKQIKAQGVEAKEREKIKAEINLLSMLEHKYIVKYLGSYVKDGRVNIVMEYCSGGSLLGLIQNYQSQGGLPEIIVQRYVFQIVAGIDYLHTKSLMHRDIKPANILVAASGICKVADFGASKHLSNRTMATFSHTNATKTEVAGTPLYMAPEMILGKADLRSDVWSIGCTVVEMLDGQRPWHHMSHLEAIPLCMYIATEDVTPLIPSCGDKAKSFLQRCLVRDVNKRASTRELMQHPFIETHDVPAGAASQSLDRARDKIARSEQAHDDLARKHNKVQEENKLLQEQIDALRQQLALMQQQQDSPANPSDCAEPQSAEKSCEVPSPNSGTAPTSSCVQHEQPMYYALDELPEDYEDPEALGDSDEDELDLSI